MEIGAVSAFLFKQCHYHIFQHDPAAAACCSGRLCICPVQIPGEDDPVWDYDDDAHDTGTADLYAAVFDLFQDGTDQFLRQHDSSVFYQCVWDIYAAAEFYADSGRAFRAARLDQASEWQIIRHIMVPMARPTIVTLMLLTFISRWNDYFWPLVMTTNDKVRTLSIGVSMLKNTEGGASWNVLMAGNVILVLPILIVFVCAQRHIIRAFTYTGEK